MVMSRTRLETLLLMASFWGAAIAQDCSWRDAVDTLPQLSTLQKLVSAAGAELPANATEVSTLLLPSVAAFAQLLKTMGVAEAELESLAIDDALLFEQVNAVMMMHVLPFPGLQLEQLAAASPLPTATSLINGTGLYNVSVSQDLQTVKAALNEANILSTVAVCGTAVHTIDKVLLAAALEDMPQVTADDISAFFAGDFNTSLLPASPSPSPVQPSPSPILPSPVLPSPSPPAEPTSTVLTMAEVANHNSRQSLWIVVDGKVFDITQYLGQHPGGDSIMVQWGGKDATQIFYRDHRGNQAFSDLEQYHIGDVAA